MARPPIALRSTAITCCVAIAVFAIGAAGASAGAATVEEWRADRRELGALMTLHAVAEAERRFHDEDRDRDGRADYATLDELIEVGLLAEELRCGELDGYRLEIHVRPSRDAWLGTVNAVVCPPELMRSYARNEGHPEVHYMSLEPIRATDHCVIPTNCLVVGT